VDLGDECNVISTIVEVDVRDEFDNPPRPTAGVCPVQSWFCRGTKSGCMRQNQKIQDHQIDKRRPEGDGADGNAEA